MNISNKEYYKRAIEIKYNDSLSINVTFIRLNRGTIHFNNKYYTGSYINSFDDINEIWNLKTPCRLSKKHNNDTIQLKCVKKTKYLILDTHRDTTKTVGDMSIPEFYRKYIKTTKK